MLAGPAGAQRFIVICTVPVPRDFSRMREKCVRKASLSNKTMRVLRPLGRKHLTQPTRTDRPSPRSWQTKCKFAGPEAYRTRCPAHFAYEFRCPLKVPPAARGLSLGELGALATLL